MRKYILCAAIAFTACNTGNKQPAAADTTGVKQAVPAPVFSADSAYAHIEKQVAFGPRVPGTPAQVQCADWLVARLKPLADTVYHKTVSIKPSGSSISLPCINI